MILAKIYVRIGILLWSFPDSLHLQLVQDLKVKLPVG